MPPAVCIPVNDPTRPGEVRRAAVALAAGLSEDERGRVALVATEAATNLLKHARGGEVVLRELSEAEGGGVEVLALDRGPGVADLGRALRDGFSTAGSAGNGLGAIGRLADVFDIVSTPAGTVLVARVRPGGAPAPAVEVGVVCLPVAGETQCGDGWAVAADGGCIAVLVADGLGHGPRAADASRAAVRAFQADPFRPPDAALHSLHAALRPTRGAAALVVVIDTSAGSVASAGVGNVAGAVVAPDGTRHGLVSHGGTLGHEARKVQAFAAKWPAGGLLLLHSDGLASQWDLTRTPGLIGRHAALAAGVLYRDGRRERDDVTVLALRAGGKG